MRPFDYERATSIQQALDLIEGDAVFLAGGTNLVDHLRLGIRAPARVVDISGLGLDEIVELPDGALRIGALVRNSDMAAHALVRGRYPFVTQALVSGASAQLRNMATTGGNLLQRTRCVYFQDLSTPCNKRTPGTGCSAIDGFGRYNALIGSSDACVAVHPSDLCVPLAALDAVVVVAGKKAERRIPFSQFHRLPGDTPEIDTNLAADELIVAVEIPSLSFGGQSRYRKVRERASYAFALVSVAAALDVADGRIRDIRLALGGVSHRPHRARVAEDALRGGPATTDEFLRAADEELRAAQVGRENAFKIPLLRNTIASVLSELTNGAKP